MPVSVEPVTVTEPSQRTDPPYAVDEVTMLRAFLDHHRDTLRWKTGGLTQAQLITSHPPSTLTLARLLKHLALVEDWWFGVNLAGVPTVASFSDVDFDVDPESEFRTALDDRPADLYALLESVVATSDAHIDAALASGGLDTIAYAVTHAPGKGCR